MASTIHPAHSSTRALPNAHCEAMGVSYCKWRNRNCFVRTAMATWMLLYIQFNRHPIHRLDHTLKHIADIVWKQKEYHIIFVIGAIPMFVSFFIIALLTHYQDWDPLLDLFQNIGRQCQRVFCCGRGNLRSGYQRSRDRTGTSGYIFDRQERESLIGQNDCDNELTNSSENSNEMNSDHLLISQECNENNFGRISASDISESEPM